MPLVQILNYLALAIAFIAMFAKAMRYFTAPQHLRWELYPVPHEKGRAEYGGSYLEELDWWSKPRRPDTFNEIKEMMREIFLLKGVYHHNRKVWRFSLPFHLGLYLCIGWLVLLLVGAIMERAGVAVSASAGIIGVAVHYLTIVFGYAGLILSGLGALGLLQWRMSDTNQRPYNAPAEYVNLLVFVAVAAVTLIGQLTADPGFVVLRGYTASLASFSTATLPGTLLTVEIVLVSLLIMYIPLTRMSHFVAKYFLYHAVRWNDQPNERGSKLEKSLIKLLQQNVEWKAPHIQTGSRWSEVVKEMNHE